jgi:hypothetical protein
VALSVVRSTRSKVHNFAAFSTSRSCPDPRGREIQGAVASFRKCSADGRRRSVRVGRGRTQEPLPPERTGALSWADSASALVVAGVGFEPT